MDRITIATRRSPLALAQTSRVAATLRAHGMEVGLLELVTTGDRWSANGGSGATRGLFVKELEEALLDGRADLAVHSAKDLPAILPPGLGIVAVPRREDPRDVVVGPAGGLDALPDGAIVGTGSPRREMQLRLRHPNLTFREIRGNVGTRIAKLHDGEFDAIIPAAAGLNRLNMAPPNTTPLAIDDCVPAPGQGALALEGRIGRPELFAATECLHDTLSGRCLQVERAVLTGLGGGCREPIGALAQADGEGLRLHVFAATEDGSRHTRVTSTAGDLNSDEIARIVERVQGDIAS